MYSGAALIQTYQDYVTENDLTVQQVVDDREGRLQAMGEGIYTIVVGTPSVVEFPVKAMEPSALPDIWTMTVLEEEGK